MDLVKSKFTDIINIQLKFNLLWLISNIFKD